MPRRRQSAVAHRPARRGAPSAALRTALAHPGGRHTIQIRPGVPNAKEGGPFFHMTGYEVVQ
jgi:hypothetical protein